MNDKKQAIKLDESKPFGRTIGDPNVSYKQDGFDFDSNKELIPGSRNSASAQISRHIERVVEKKPVFEDMHIHALKKHAETKYAEMEAAGVDFEPVEAGKGMQERLIAFLKAN